MIRLEYKNYRRIMRQMKVDLLRYGRRVLKATAEEYVKYLRKEVRKSRLTGFLEAQINVRGIPKKGGWAYEVYAPAYIYPLSYGAKPHHIPKEGRELLKYGVIIGKYRFGKIRNPERIAKAIAWRISQKGTRARGYLQSANRRLAGMVRKAAKKSFRKRV